MTPGFVRHLDLFDTWIYHIDITDWFIGTSMLPNESFPIIFESVKGNCEQSANSPSLFNNAEVKVVMRYVHKILDGKWKDRSISLADIGIVSPYRKQCDLIRSECFDSGFGGITVGTAEIFQGQEKPVMIISTVRSPAGNRGGSLGFVKDQRVSNIINIL